MKNIAEELISYSKEDYYPWHMPGHKRNPFSVNYSPSIETDITEIDGFDNLHAPQGIIREAEKRAASLYGVKKTYFSVNGSTGALLSAISATTSIGGEILVARNCHKAVYHGIYLRQLKPTYLYPEWEETYGLNGGIRPEDVEKALREEEGIQAILITSPTYDGVVSDIDAISAICHKYGKPLIVDEAHGAHFIFHERFPKSALEQGADVVIHSLHKTLPSMTQTSLLHRNSDRVSEELLDRYMRIYQSSSPSYPLMASIDSCICGLQQQGRDKFCDFVGNLEEFYGEISQLHHIKYVPQRMDEKVVLNRDISKLIFFADGMTGKEFYDTLLDKYHLQMEMETPAYVLGIATIADTMEGFHRLAAALKEIDESIECGFKEEEIIPWRGKSVEQMLLYEALDRKKEQILLENAVGRVCGDFISLYPPGIPLIVPGEIITDAFIRYIKQCIVRGLKVQGVDRQGKIGVVYE